MTKDFNKYDSDLFKYFCESRGVSSTLEKLIFNNEKLFYYLAKETYPNSEEKQKSMVAYFKEHGMKDVVDTQVVFNIFMKKIGMESLYDDLVEARLISDNNYLRRLLLEVLHKYVVGSNKDTTLVELAYKLLSYYYENDDLFSMLNGEKNIPDLDTINNAIKTFYDNMSKGVSDLDNINNFRNVINRLLYEKQIKAIDENINKEHGTFIEADLLFRKMKILPEIDEVMLKDVNEFDLQLKRNLKNVK